MQTANARTGYPQFFFHIQTCSLDQMSHSSLGSVKSVKLRGTYIDFNGPLHAQKQGVEIDVVNWRPVRPFRVVTFDFQSDPYPFHVSHAWQKGGDEV